ncbi:hypothetical protein MTBSS4_770001 [Magnetospirillum sp. SS-4]|nr:hypothetical protein MTBSS4_770001 [Magnetospirillum sp. SS-4]
MHDCRVKRQRDNSLNFVNIVNGLQMTRLLPRSNMARRDKAAKIISKIAFAAPQIGINTMLGLNCIRREQ